VDRVEELQEEVVQLRQALSSRAVIDQAKGMLMARYGVSADHAFELLARKSQEQNAKVRVIAEAMVNAAAHGNFAPEAWGVAARHGSPSPEGPHGELR
jgi:AmiR/NasT family two-component response regulator